MKKAAVTALAGALALGAIPALRAQAPGAPAFEVASVKPIVTRNGSMALNPGGRYFATGVTLRQMIVQAYPGLLINDLIDAPAWVNTDQYEILAKVDSAYLDKNGLASPGQVSEMVAALLADRFKLAAHRETRDLPIYSLELARSDGRLGARLRPSTSNCVPRTLMERIVSNTFPGDTTPRPRQCRENFAATRTSGEMTMSRLAIVLSGSTRRHVTDRTGLAGVFEVDLEWAPDQAPRASDPLNPPPPPNPNAASMFTALQEQLGLKLESARGPVEVLVIDHVEKPAPE